ncbi:MAG: ribbon-helix-helix protein, CopG family [Deltaproteobacteria bacterium]|nr:ribbon-helix-helix protein, CopG family [Deltaproteobacteria bacterium]
MRINAIMSDDLVAALDAMAREHHKSRSELLREAAELLISTYQRQREEEQRRARRQKAIETQELLRQKAGDWDGVAEVRKWREPGG